MKTSESISIFVEEIWRWFAVHKRTLPWRDLKVKDPSERAYRILVSEIMLQQTQVSRVKTAYPQFLEKFPQMKDLAAASTKDVLLSWRGMGYNSRALRLRDGVRRIVNDRNAVFPSAMEDLQSIPGIGHYTAGAIRNFAFDIPTPCIDTNIRRILHRTFVGPENRDGTWKKDDVFLLKIAQQILDVAVQEKEGRSTADWHAALMDFGSLVCTKRHPKWEECPLTARGIMKAAYKVQAPPKKTAASKEPGRMVGTVFIPNRIFRGRIIDELRDILAGLTLDDLGPRICLDWSPREHRRWLQTILEKLATDRLIDKKQDHYILAE